MPEYVNGGIRLNHGVHGAHGWEFNQVVGWGELATMPLRFPFLLAVTAAFAVIQLLLYGFRSC